MDTCQLLTGYLDTLAAKFPATKFVSIVGDKVSDDRLLTLLDRGIILMLYLSSVYQITQIVICPR